MPTEAVATTPPQSLRCERCDVVLQIVDAEHRCCPRCGRRYELRMVIEGQTYWASPPTHLHGGK
jgi:phage FluMu protein Com